MDTQELARLAEHAKRNPKFIAEFRKDPVQATTDAGFQLSQDDATQLRGQNRLSGMSDDEIAKGMTGFLMVE
jgi:hypothetical protein